jgi:hypothetical protein
MTGGCIIIVPLLFSSQSKLSINILYYIYEDKFAQNTMRMHIDYYWSVYECDDKSLCMMMK